MIEVVVVHGFGGEYVGGANEILRPKLGTSSSSSEEIEDVADSSGTRPTMRLLSVNFEWAEQADGGRFSRHVGTSLGHTAPRQA